MRSCSPKRLPCESVKRIHELNLFLSSMGQRQVMSLWLTMKAQRIAASPPAPVLMTFEMNLTNEPVHLRIRSACNSEGCLNWSYDTQGASGPATIPMARPAPEANARR